jgi:hypothetical protein
LFHGQTDTLSATGIAPRSGIHPHALSRHLQMGPPWRNSTSRKRKGKHVLQANSVRDDLCRKATAVVQINFSSRYSCSSPAGSPVVVNVTMPERDNAGTAVRSDGVSLNWS